MIQTQMLSPIMYCTELISFSDKKSMKRVRNFTRPVKVNLLWLYLSYTKGFRFRANIVEKPLLSGPVRTIEIAFI